MDAANWAKQQVPHERLPLALRFPGMVEPTEQILNTMADTPGCALSVPQIYEYLTAPKGPRGAGLAPGKDVAEDLAQYRNWLMHSYRALWSLRGGKRAL